MLEVKELHQNHAKLKAKIISLRKKWVEHREVIRRRFDEIIDSHVLAAYTEGYRDAKVGKANKYFGNMDL